MRKKKEFDNEFKENVKKMYESGMDMIVISIKLNISEYYLRSIFREMGIRSRSRKIDLEQFKKLIEEEYSDYELAGIFHRSISTIKSTRVSMGIARQSNSTYVIGDKARLVLGRVLYELKNGALNMGYGDLEKLSGLRKQILQRIIMDYEDKILLPKDFGVRRVIEKRFE